MLRILNRNNGISLIEAIIALAIICSVGAVFLTGLDIGIRSEKVHGQQADSRILATGTMEFVKSQPCSDNTWSYMVSSSEWSSSQLPSWWDENNPPLLDSVYSSYSINVSAQDFDKDNDGILEVPGDDDGIRRLTVKVYDNSARVTLSLEDYKAMQ